MPSDHPTILITAPFRGEGLEKLERLGHVIYDPWIDTKPLRIYGPDQLAARIDETGAEILIAEGDFCFGAVLERPLRLIGSTRGAPTNVDLEGATARGIPVLHTPGRNADAVAEMTIALMFAVARHIIPADRDLRAGENVKDGQVSYQRFRGWELAGRTAGIIGLGAVGRAVKWRLEGLGMTVIATDPFNADAKHTLDEVVSTADVVTVHAAPTPETLGMIGAAEFAAMKPGAIYINAARAGLHDLDALTEALASGHLSGAGLDHFDGEKLPKGHPLISMPQTVLTPHIGGATHDTEVNHSRMIADDVETFLAGGRPRHVANPEVFDG
jgi:D-3-phosphoglycerate dehydrogenase